MGMKKNETQGSSSSSTNHSNQTNHFSSTINHLSPTKHFSHQHPLKLIQQSPESLLPASCEGCHWPSDSDSSIYICTVCPFYLHKSCFDMPTSLTHRSHKAHPLTLFAKPVYPGGVMVCNACRGQGSTFSYHCGPCGIDLHLRCAAIPLSTVHSYHEHKLELAFESPYGEMDYTCGICKMSGNKQWLYRCKSCRLDVHVKCAYEHDIPGTSDQTPPQQQDLTSFMNNVSQHPSQQQLTNYMNNRNNSQQQLTNYMNNRNNSQQQLTNYMNNRNNLTNYYMNNHGLRREVAGGSGLRLEPAGNNEYQCPEKTERPRIYGETSNA